MLTLVAFVFVLGVLIFVHELGHFLAAKAVGIGVPRFSIGFGPPTPLRFQRGETEYRVSWIPLGGYVKMASKEEQEAVGALEGGDLQEEYPSEKLFESKSLGSRILVISAGVAMNAVFAWAVYFGLSLTYGRAEDPTTRIAGFDEELLPAAAQALAGLQYGTHIVRINGDTVASLNAVREAILDVRSESLRFEFAGRLDPIVVRIPGTDATARVDLHDALIPLHPARVSLVAVGKPASDAGMEPSDLVVRMDGDTVRTWYEMVAVIEPAAGDTIALTVQRADTLIELVVVPEQETVRDPVSGESREVGRIGIAGPRVESIRVEFGVAGAVAEGLRLTWYDASRVLYTLWGMVTARISPRELGGPIYIGQVSGQIAQAGILPLLYFMAFLSVNLAVLNLLPIPVLDGGHLIFLLIEGIRGKPLSLDTRLRLTQVGLFVLLGIMAFALTNDLFRVIGR
ncbi:MAG: RIP metalloprotease RseP [Gemmatimonadota bacterium]|nr:MAG: RIP metalloprotease RseP [Gemmatimonadota bacterium]